MASAAVVPRFEVASVKPCRTYIPPGGRTGGIASPELLDIDCSTVRELIKEAYVTFGSGTRVTPLNTPIEGGPGWTDSERYEIKARAPGVTNQVILHGPMLQALLEDRFGLRIHRETREISVYALVVAKGGSKLHPFREGTCNAYDITASFPPPPPPDNPCRNRGTLRGGLIVLDIQGATLDEFATMYLRNVDRPVINRTGIKGRFDIHLEFAPDENMVPFPGDLPATESTGPSIFTALQEQLGLKVEPSKGPGEFLVIDGVERPSEN